MGSERRSIGWALFGCSLMVFLGPSAARAASVTADFSANHVNIRAVARSSYYGPLITDITPASGRGSDSGTGAPAIYSHPPYRDDVFATSNMDPFGGGAPKDHMAGSAQLVFVHGLGASDDAIQYSFHAEGSALFAFDSFAEPANGRQRNSATASFFVDANYGPTPVPPGTHVGRFHLPAVRNALPLETINGTVSEDGGVVYAFGASSSAFDVGLFAGHSYRVQIEHILDVPNGREPQANFK